MVVDEHIDSLPQNKGIQEALTPAKVRDSWDFEYCNNPQTDWERLPLNDQFEFIKVQKIDFTNLHNILEIGCGRGYRTLYMLLKEARLNRNDVRLTAIDISPNAIESAQRSLQAFNDNYAIPTSIAYLFNSKPCALQCQMAFEVADIIRLPTHLANQKYDLGVDWMCFHDFPIGLREAYVDIVEKLCGHWFILNVFSHREASPVKELGYAIPEVIKYAFRNEDIGRLFPNFDIVNMTDTCEENVEPDPPHSDGKVSAKRAYLLRRH